MMTKDFIEKIVQEVREEYQIPPYFPDSSIANFVVEGDAQFSDLVHDIDYEKDQVYPMLLKTYVFYAYHKKIDEYWIKYNPNILGWQMSFVGSGESNE